MLIIPITLSALSIIRCYTAAHYKNYNYKNYYTNQYCSEEKDFDKDIIDTLIKLLAIRMVANKSLGLSNNDNVVLANLAGSFSKVALQPGQQK